MKICNKCNIEKSINNFYKSSKGDGYRNICKECYKIYHNKEKNKIYKILNKEKIKIQKKEYNKKRYLDKKDKILNNNKNYIKNNPHYHTEYVKTRCENDPFYKFKRNIRGVIADAFKRTGYKKCDKTENILGCSINEFKEYIINQFEDWMTLENNGIYTGQYNETWQIDHIYPISAASSPEEVIKLNHYTNLRPLCSRKNLEKSNTIVSETLTK